MSTRVVDRVENWNERSFTEGYQTLADLADEEFSGVIRTNGTALFMTKGVPIHIEDGEMADFERASGTIYESPSPALPVLAVMQSDNEGVRDELYSEKTSLAEVDTKLSDGGFTGYIELSENVLSGDYYVVYHGGRSMSVGFVGESARLIDGDEAFETANDEVGIYQIRPAEIRPLEIPEPPEPTEDPEETLESEPTAKESHTGDDPAAETESETDSSGETAAGMSADGQDSSPTTPATETEQTATSESAEPIRDTTSSETADTAKEPEKSPPTQSTERESDTTAQPQQSEQSIQPTGNTPETGQRRTESNQQTPQGTHRQPGPRQNQQGKPQAQNPAASGPQLGTQQMETHAIPSLDPTRTQKKRTKPSVTNQAARAGPQNAAQQPTQAQQNPQAAQSGGNQPAQQPHSQGQEPDSGATQHPEGGDENALESAHETADESETPSEQRKREKELETLESAKEQLDERVEQLETEREELEAENEELTAELEAVRSERDELAAEVEQLESELNRLETELGAATDAEQRIPPAEALLGTDIFVRYQSKGEATLDAIHDGKSHREEFNSNLRLEKHTQFEAESVSVGGQTYAEFLDSTVEYQFVEWLVRDLLFEIQDTGHTKGLKELYDTIPKVDRAELGGTVTIRAMEDGEKITLEESFDVVLRDRMGEPLLVANLNDSREAATAGMMEQLITSAERVGESFDTFGGAFLVTRSFFEPGALEIASEATQSGFLKRDKRKSFVNLSRKTGYHLCLVEARNDNFHMAVPEL